MKINFKKLAILSIASFSLFASHRAFAMNPTQKMDNTYALTRIIPKYIENTADLINLGKTCKNAKALLDRIEDTTANGNDFPISLSRNDFGAFKNLKTYIIYGINPNEFKPISFYEHISDNKTINDTNITKIIYKTGSFNANTIVDVMNSGIDKMTIKTDNLENMNNNVDFDIVCDFGDGKTIEFEVRLGELSINPNNNSLSIVRGLIEYNTLVRQSKQFVPDANINTIDREGITDFICPKDIQNIDAHSFNSCKNLKTVTIQEGVQNIGNEAFSYRDKLQSINIPNSVKTIGYSSFSFCSELKDIHYNGKTYKSVFKFLNAFKANGGQVVR